MDLNKLFEDKSNNWKPKKPKQVLIPILEKAIIKYNQERKQTSPTMFRASDLGCDRKFLLKHQGNEEEISAESYLIMNVGTSIHELIQTYLKDHFISLEERLYFNDTAGDCSENDTLSGSYDGHLKLDDFGECLLEIKSTHADNYQRLCKFAAMSNKYKLQNHVYLHSKGLKKSIFIFFNKNCAWTQDFKEKEPDIVATMNPIFLEVILEKDDKYVEMIKEKIKNRKLHMKLGSLPKFEKQSECDYCHYGPNKTGLCKTLHLQEKQSLKDEKAASKIIDSSKGKVKKSPKTNN